MKQILWSEIKNAWLRYERGVSFEDVQTLIESGNILDIKEHHNKTRYPNQRIYVLAINGYAHLIPCVEDDEKIFLKTIIPSRKATKEYLSGGVQP